MHNVHTIKLATWKNKFRAGVLRNCQDSYIYTIMLHNNSVFLSRSRWHKSMMSDPMVAGESSDCRSKFY